MKKTNIKINGNEKYYRVKVDKKLLPYIVVDNEKLILNSCEFPRVAYLKYGLEKINLDIISGKEELEKILSNPELTVDKMTLKEIMRIG